MSERDDLTAPTTEETLVAEAHPLPPLQPTVDETARPPELEPASAPEELTGRASKTEEDLEALFDNENDDHLVDGFKGGSGDEPTPQRPAPEP